MHPCMRLPTGEHPRLALPEGKIDGMTYEQTRYNVYAFGADVTRYRRKRAAARKDHTRQAWDRKIHEWEIYLTKNQRRLDAFLHPQQPLAS